MKTIKQQAEVSFKLLDFADKIVMLPIMDALADSIKEGVYLNLNNDYVSEDIEQEQAKKILKILSDLGCRTSLGESYEDIVKSDNSQENKEQ